MRSLEFFPFLSHNNALNKRSLGSRSIYQNFFFTVNEVLPIQKTRIYFFIHSKIKMCKNNQKFRIRLARCDHFLPWLWPWDDQKTHSLRWNVICRYFDPFMDNGFLYRWEWSVEHCFFSHRWFIRSWWDGVESCWNVYGLRQLSKLLLY